jgi:hypothetical protein
MRVVREEQFNKRGIKGEVSNLYDHGWTRINTDFSISGF